MTFLNLSLYLRNKNKLTTYEDNDDIFLAVKNRKGMLNIDENLWEDLDFHPSSGNSKVNFFDSNKRNKITTNITRIRKLNLKIYKRSVKRQITNKINTYL